MSKKRLKIILKKHSGRDNKGHVSVRHQGGRQKRYYRLVDFKRDKEGKAKIVSIEYDPNRSCNVSRIKYEDGEERYILHPEGVKVGDIVEVGESVSIKEGNTLPLVNIPIGVEVHNIEIRPGQGGKIIRGAGEYGVVVAKEEKFVHVKLPSREVRRFNKESRATVGKIDNASHKYEKIGKAGRKRLMGIRPTVRGTAQDPRSHPHGGGEGRSGEGMIPKTPWGKVARGKRTRKKNKWSDKLIVKRRK